jgi:hypothetical protein
MVGVKVKHKLRCTQAGERRMALSLRLDQPSLHLIALPAHQYGPSEAQHLMYAGVPGKHPNFNLAPNTDLDIFWKLFLDRRRPGMAFLISDLFSPAGFQTGVNQLLHKAGVQPFA